jgi:3-hydroxy-3-methylglutaryl CoA synthase
MKSLGGERAVARYDEDSLTMAVGATLDCIRHSQHKADGLFFASTTSPYKEKQTAAIIAASVDLPGETRTADFTDSLRSGTMALSSAIDAVKSGSARNIIVVASDCRMGAGKSQFEQLFGDGAVALAIGSSDVIASIEGSYSLFSERLETWRLEGTPFVQSWEERFVVTEGYMNTMQAIISGVMERYQLKPREFAKVVFYGPDSKSHANLSKRLGFDFRTQVQDPLFESFGNMGTAALPIMLAAALRDAHPNDRILAANYGDGADALILRVTENIGQVQEKEKMKKRLEKKIYISYERYLTWRDLVPLEDPRRPSLRPPSITCLWRERKSVLTLYGSRCKQCGTVQYPPQRICANCQTKDMFEDYKLSDKQGKIFTYAIDYLTSGKEAPALIGVVDFEGGGRIMCEIAECEPSEIKIGMPVEMCFKKLEEGGGIHNYFWKARPVS